MTLTAAVQPYIPTQEEYITSHKARGKSYSSVMCYIATLSQIYSLGNIQIGTNESIVIIQWETELCNEWEKQLGSFDEKCSSLYWDVCLLSADFGISEQSFEPINPGETSPKSISSQCCLG